MKTTQLNQSLVKSSIVFGLAASMALSITSVQAQSIEEVRWKSESQVLALYGEPQSVSSPVGTHASYSMWKYADFTVAFANNRAFHLFKKDSLKKFGLDENRDQP